MTMQTPEYSNGGSLLHAVGQRTAWWVHTRPRLTVALAYGVTALSALIRHHAEPRGDYADLLARARLAYRRPRPLHGTPGALLSHAADIGSSSLPPDVMGQASAFAARHLADTPEAMRVVGHALVLALESRIVDDVFRQSGLSDVPGAILYRALHLGERPTTTVARAAVVSMQPVLGRYTRRKALSIEADAVIWADVHAVYHDDLDAALVGRYGAYRKPQLSRVVAPFYKAMGAPLRRGPKVGPPVPLDVPRQAAWPKPGEVTTTIP